MPIRVLGHNTSSVYLADSHGTPTHRPDLQAVTFLDELHTPHTVFAHVEAYEQDAVRIIEAFYDGTLTVEKAVEPEPADDTHDQAGG